MADTRASSMSLNTKKILYSLGALVDGAYLWAGADKGIESEMQGKNNGTNIYYTISDFGDVACSELTKGGEDVGSSLFGGAALSANSVKQRDVSVKIRDARVMLETNAFERMLTSMGEIEAQINIGQKLAKSAIKQVMPDDMASIGNVFVGENYRPYQLAGAYLKSYLPGKLYGFMDWQAWGKLTSQGQQAVPCNLARPEFGNQLVGKWSLVDELRVIPDIPVMEFKALGSCTAAASTKDCMTAVAEGLTVTAGAAVTAGNYMIKVPGIYNTDCNGSQAGEFTFTVKLTASVAANGTFKVDLPVGTVIPTAVSGATVTSVISSASGSLAGAGTYAACIVRGERAQVFGTAHDVGCKSAKYSKQSYEGFNIHVNEDSDVAMFKDVKRWDLVLASKLVEPRAAAIVWLRIDN